MSKSDRYKTLEEKRADYVGETFGGTVVDVDGKNPVISSNQDVPNIIVSNEKASDWSIGDVINAVRIEAVPEKTYMFGDRIRSDEEREEENSGDYSVVFEFMGNRLESQNFSDKENAEDLKEFLEAHMDIGRVTVERTR